MPVLPASLKKLRQDSTEDILGLKILRCSTFMPYVLAEQLQHGGLLDFGRAKHFDVITALAGLGCQDDVLHVCMHAELN